MYYDYHTDKSNLDLRQLEQNFLFVQLTTTKAHSMQNCNNRCWYFSPQISNILRQITKTWRYR